MAEQERVGPGPEEGEGPDSGVGGASGSGDADEVAADIENELALLVRERDDLLDTSRRLQADFENYRKRVLREQIALVERATEALVEQLLPVLDSFGLAVLNLADGDVDVEKVRRGVDLVYAELLGVLERAGLSRVEGKGAPFDPTQHEAVLHEAGDGEPVVAEVMRPGWKLKGRVLRPAMVKVDRPTTTAKTSDQAGEAE